MGNVRQEDGEQADQGEVGAQFIHHAQAGAVGQLAEQGGADAGEAEGQAEEEAGDGAHFARHQILGVDQDGGEGRGQDQADQH